MSNHTDTSKERLLKENKNYIIKDNLQFTVNLEYFKDNGYTHQELFAENIPYYHKKINTDHHIWCNLKYNQIHVEDWYGFLTPTILNYYIQNKNTDKVKTSTAFKNFKYIACKINRETGEIKTRDEILKELSDEKPISLDTLEKYENSTYSTEWKELILSTNEMDILVDEINRLTNNKFK